MRTDTASCGLESVEASLYAVPRRIATPRFGNGILKAKMQRTPANTKSADGKFTKALASVLAVKPADMRDALAKAKDEQPSPHTRYKYDPEADRS
jgi:hypothetical protein